MPLSKLIIVGGAPRSGTTLVQNILDSHPAIYGGPEFGQLSAIINLRRSFHQAVNSGVIAQYLTIDEVDEGLRKLVLDWFTIIATKKGVKNISEKSPDNSLYLKELLDLFPLIRGIHVIRDPRAVLASMIKVKNRHVIQGLKVPERIATISSMSKTIASHLLEGIKAAQIHNDRILIVRYEDLVRETEHTVRRICAHIGLDFYIKMLNPADFIHDAEVLVNAGTPWYNIEEFYRNPDHSRIMAWKDEISDREIQELVKAFGHDIKYINEFSYQII